MSKIESQLKVSEVSRVVDDLLRAQEEFEVFRDNWLVETPTLETPPGEFSLWVREQEEVLDTMAELDPLDERVDEAYTLLGLLENAHDSYHETMVRLSLLKRSLNPRSRRR